MAEVVILGAGLTGLSAAYHLEKYNFFDFKIFESEQLAGGLARSVYHDSFTFDYTGHFLHCNDDYFKSFLDLVLPEKERCSISRNSFVYTHNEFIPYPFQINLNGLPNEVVVECLCGFAKRKHQIQNPKTFRDWVIKYFGSGIAKHFFFPYNKKLLQYSLGKVTPSWAGRFVPKTDIEEIVENIKNQKSSKNVGYNYSFLYPKVGGIQTFVEKIVKKITTPILTNHKAVSVDLTHKKVFFENGHVEPFKYLITTMPLNNFLHMLREPANIDLKRQHRKLKCNSVINFNIGFRASDTYDKHWIYIPEKKYEFYRVGFWNNFSPTMVPLGCASMYGELAYLPYKEHSIDRVERSINQSLEIFGISKNNVVTEKILQIEHAYVIYDGWRERNILSLRKRLHDQGIFSVGRYGEWKYSTMQDAILDGRNVVVNTLHQLCIKYSESSNEALAVILR